MASNMEYEADSPLSYDVEEGELGPGRSSLGTIRENETDCSTQTDDNNETRTIVRVEVDNSTIEQQKSHFKNNQHHWKFHASLQSVP